MNGSRPVLLKHRPGPSQIDRSTSVHMADSFNCRSIMSEIVKIHLDNVKGRKIPLSALHEEMIADKISTKGCLSRGRYFIAMKKIKDFIHKGNDVVVVTNDESTSFLDCVASKQMLATQRLVRHVNAVARRRSAVARRRSAMMEVVATPSTPKKQPVQCKMPITSPVPGLCVECGGSRRSDNKATLEMQRKDMVTNTGIEYQRNYRELCMACFTQGIAAKKERIADDAVDAIVANMQLKPRLFWPCGPGSRIEITMKAHSKCLHPALEKVFSHCDSFASLASENLIVRHVHINDTEDEDMLLDCIGGRSARDRMPSHRVLMAPTDGTFGYITLPVADSNKRHEKGMSPNNHILMHNIDFLAEDVLDLMKEESPFIDQIALMKRPGAAGGYHLPTDNATQDPMTLSIGTRAGQTYMMQEDTKSTGVTVSYWSQKARKMIRRRVYADMKGRVLKANEVGGKDSKFKWAFGSPSYCNILVKTMEARIKYLVILEAHGHHPESLLEEMVEWAEGWQSISSMFKSFAPEIKDDWKRFLLLYQVLNLDSHINHEACKAHVDSNGNETLSLFGRWNGGNDTQDFTDTLTNAAPGELALLNVAMGIRMLPHRTVVHATLDETLHVPDCSRNNLNTTVSDHKKRRQRCRRR